MSDTNGREVGHPSRDVDAIATSVAGSAAELVAFLFTDIEGSSLRWLNHRAAMQAAVREHDHLLNVTVTAHGGRVFKTTGDGLYAAFRLPADAINAAVAAQQALASRDWSAVGGLAVRMAVHVGTAQRRDDDYFGPALNRAARLLPLAHGGQVLVSASAAEMVAAERDSAHALRLLGTHPLDDPLQPVGLYQVSVPGSRHDFPPLRTEDLRPTNLPRQLAPLIGRAADRDHLLALLAVHPLVTLTGAGGVGKTRLALDVAAQKLSDFAQGVWLMELAPINDPTLVPGVVASALEIQLSPNQAPLKILTNRLRTQELLLVLDNCEHLIDAAAHLAETVLAAAPKVRVLATSREPLGLAGECVVRLPSLAVPDAGDVAAADALRTGAVQLFVERARAADARFVIDDQSAAIVAAICRRLDGIPLAIEMAAARVSLFGVERLAQKLDDRFRVLTRGRRTALPRQQTLRATLDWSYELLSEHERVVLRRSAIFAGSFTLDAAGAVLADPALDEFAVIDVLAQLVARSLVVADSSETATRYRLLETTRAYASERLAEASETGALARTHAGYYRDLFERAYVESWALSDAAWRDAYAAERDNVRAALEWALGADGDRESAVALAGASSPLWTHLALAAEERAWLERALPYVHAAPARIAARVWHRLGASYVEATPKRALAAFQSALALPREQIDMVTLASLLRTYAGALEITGRANEASAALAEALPLAERSGLARLMSEVIATRASVRLPAGDARGARSDQEAALALCRSVGAERNTLNTLSNLADADWALGDVAQAIAGFREAAARLRQAAIVHRDLLGLTLGNLVGALTEQGDLEEARTVAAEALPLLREEQTVWLWFDHFALRVGARGRIGDAARLAGYADAMLAAHDRVRQPNESRARQSLHAILSDKLAPDVLTRLLAEGADLSEDEACRIALAD